MSEIDDIQLGPHNLPPIRSLPVVQTSRCTGHCCVRFPLPYSPDELNEKKDIFQDGPQIADMVVFIESQEPTGNGITWHYYTCSNLTEDRNCSIYEERPAMCAQYPYGLVCEHTECTRATS